MYKEINEKFDRYIDAHKEEMIDVISELVKYPSVKGEPCENAPYGVHCRECLDASVEIMKKYGFDAKTSNGGKYGVANFGQGDKTIGIFVHTDVVPASESDWIYTKPFCPKKVGDVLFGRGVQDDKAGVAAAIFSVKMLCDAGIKLKNKISVFLGSDEETGMGDIEAYTAENSMPDVSIVPDGDFPVAFGEKSICHVHIFPDGKFENVTEFCGGTAYNIMLDRVKVKIKYKEDLYREICEKSKDNGRLTVEKDGDQIEILATGVAKHAAMPEGGINAAQVASKMLSECRCLCKNDRELFSKIEEITGDFYGEKLGVACSDPFFGPLTSVNGICSISNDGVPDIALDIRYGTAIVAEELEQKIKEAYPTARICENSRGFAIPEDDKTARSLERVYASLSGDKNAKGFYLGGGTYSRHLKKAFSVGLQAEYVECDVPELPTGHGGVHQSDEMLKLPQFFEAVKLLALMIYECDKALNDVE
ncbi:MAG: Sapep family Mn(2+)-dependent dipeptidase [Clostridia bacterium]|nr:Sapep family Mn(2+)-dependent dipeptidase [Clostridia bacterium]